jgi:hypothetical protein
MKYDYDYCLKLTELTAETLSPSAPGSKPGPFLMGFDEMTGAVTLDFHGDLSVYATPFWEGLSGIPVSAVEAAGQSIDFVLPFRRSGDLERDSKEYVRLCSMIPEILSGYFVVDRLKEVDVDSENPESVEPECDCRQFTNLGRCDHVDYLNRIPVGDRPFEGNCSTCGGDNYDPESKTYCPTCEDKEPPEEPSGFTGNPPDYSKGDE